MVIREVILGCMVDERDIPAPRPEHAAVGIAAAAAIVAVARAAVSMGASAEGVAKAAEDAAQALAFVAGSGKQD